MTPGDGASQKTHVLTVALEDYFHAPAFRGLIDKRSWARFEARYEMSSLAALELLGRSRSQATFFVNPWVANRSRDLLREVLRRGHEIALSEDGSPSFRELPRNEFRDRIRRSRDTIEEASGHRIFGYRRSDIFLRPRHLTALEVLAEEGFLYDSSLSPAGFAFWREPWRRFVHRQAYASSSIWEFPLSSQNFGGLMIPFAGGNYFRQYPEALVRYWIRRWHGLNSQPLVLYFRVWDLDPLHPRIHTGSLVRDLRHYRNSDRMVRVLSELFERYRFDSIAGALGYRQEALPDPAPRPARELSSPAPAGHAGRAGVPVSIVVPCYNEEASIPYLARALDELKAALAGDYVVQFILVDDGSADHTWTVLNERFGSRSDALLLRHERNRGVAASILTGVQRAHEIVCSMDCDCSYDPRELKPMIGLLSAGTDLVTASPYHPRGRVSNVPAWRIGLSRTASLLYQMMTGRRLYTFTSCLRVYRRSAVLSVPLQHTGYLGVAELACRFALQGRGIVEHPATIEGRLFGRSKMKIAPTIVGHLKLLADVAWSRITTKLSSAKAGPCTGAGIEPAGVERERSL